MHNTLKKNNIYQIKTIQEEISLQMNRKNIQNAKEFTEIFHEKSYNLAKEKFEQYINKYEEIPKYYNNSWKNM